MQPLGLLGALLGGYQQGRLTKQNREIKSAQLLRQQQENEALKKYRADSLELQRKRIEGTENPITKAKRDHFYRVLDAVRPEINNRTGKIFKDSQTVDEINSGLEGIHREFTPRIQGLRGLYENAEDLQGIGSFEDLISAGVPDWLRSDKFDPSMAPRPDLDMATFDKQIKDAYTGLSNQGVTDPAAQENIIGSVVTSHAARTGRNPEELWKYVSGIRPNQAYTGYTTGVNVSDPVRTQATDPTLGAFDTRTANDSQGTTTYSHAMPDNLQTLPAFNSYLQKLNGASPGFNLPSNVGIPQSVLNQKPTSNQIADDLIVDDLHNMFKSQSFRQKYGLTDVTDPKQFQRALQLYANPNTLNELKQEYNEADRYGYMSDGQKDPAYNDQRLGDFGQSPRGVGISRMIEAQPLMAQTSRFTKIPFEGRTQIPLNIDDQRDLVSLEKDREAVLKAAADGTIARVKARVAQATEPQQIAAADASLMLKTMRIVLDPLKFGLQQQNFDLDKWFKEQTLNQGGQRLVIASKDLIIKAAGPARALLMSADNETKSAGMNLTTLMQQNQMASAIFSLDPGLKDKIENATATPDEIEKLGNTIGPATDQAVKNGLERYKASLRQRASAFTAVQGFNSIAQGFANLTPDPVGTVPGTGDRSIFDDFNTDATPAPGVAKPKVKLELSVKENAKANIPRNSKNQTPANVLRAGDAGQRTSGPTTKPPSSAGGGATPPSILSAAQERLRAAGGVKPKPVATPIVPPKGKPKPTAQSNQRTDIFTGWPKSKS